MRAMKWRLPARPPFSLPAVVGSHGWIQLAPFVRQEGDHAFRYVTRLGPDRVVEMHVAAADAGVEVAVEVALDAGEQEAVSRQVTWMVALEQDLSEFYAATAGEPRLAHVQARAQGRILRSATFFEDVVKTILTTNTAWSGTKRMVGQVVARFGDPLPGDPGKQAFPSAARLVAAGEDALRAEAGLGYRAPYVAGLARAVTAGELDLEAYKDADLPTPELRKQLLAIKGVGDYAAASLLMLLGRYDWLPVDSWAHKMVSGEWHGGAPIGRAEVEAAFARWGRWKGLAYWFWDWQHLEN
jgi:3-methyladenine DNA glycosylase/8-oxoguanine DNA glycosylase